MNIQCFEFCFRLTAGYFENVIRLLLTTDPSKRGGGSINGEPVWYTNVKDIMKEKVGKTSLNIILSYTCKLNAS